MMNSHKKPKTPFEAPLQQLSSFERRRSSDGNAYEHFIFNYLLQGNAGQGGKGLGDLPPTIQTVSSQFTLDNFFAASPIGTSGAVTSSNENTLMFMENTDKKLARGKSTGEGGGVRFLIDEPTFSQQEPSQRSTRSRERRARGTRLSRDGIILAAGSSSNFMQGKARESIEDIMNQIQVKKPSPQPQPPRVFQYVAPETLAHDPKFQRRVREFTERVAVKKIQRVFRAYLFYKRIKQQRIEVSAEKRRKIQLQKILAAKVIVRNVKRWLLVRHYIQYRQHFISNVRKVQRIWKQKRILRRVKKLSKFRQRMRAVVNGWKVRQIINSLANEIQDFVNCDLPQERQRLKSVFLALYESVVHHKLWLKKNSRLLYNLKQFQHKSLGVNPNMQQQSPSFNRNPSIKVEVTQSKQILKSAKHVKSKSITSLNTLAKSSATKQQFMASINDQLTLQTSGVKNDKSFSRKLANPSLQMASHSTLITTQTGSHRLGNQTTQQTTFDHQSNERYQKEGSGGHYTPVLNYLKPHKLSVEKTLTKSTTVSTTTPTRPSSTRPASTILKSNKPEGNHSKRELSSGQRGPISHIRQSSHQVENQPKPQPLAVSQRQQKSLMALKKQNQSMDKISAYTDRPSLEINTVNTQSFAMVSAVGAMENQNNTSITRPLSAVQPSQMPSQRKSNANHKKILSDIEHLMDEVHQYNEKVASQKQTSSILKLSRPYVSCEFDKLINKLRIQMNNLLNQSDPKFTFQ